MAKKKKRLPPDFEELLAAGDLPALQAVFATHELDARGGYLKQVALAYDACPPALARWLVAQGADLEAPDAYGETPLQTRARGHRGHLADLLELGPDLRAGEGGRGTALHRAAESGNAANVRLLLARGAAPTALDGTGLTPLERALEHCRNIDIVGTVAVAEVLLTAGAAKTPRMGRAVTRIGTDFEFHRAGFDPGSRDGVSAALDRLYALFDTPPVPRRVLHDGVSPIQAPPGPWRQRHQALWALLVPSAGAAATVQGEVIRIPGRLGDEIDRNGAVNWDADYRRMGQAWLEHVSSGTPLPPAELAEARELVAGIRRTEGAAERLSRLALAWVDLNPRPVPLPAPPYRR